MAERRECIALGTVANNEEVRVRAPQRVDQRSHVLLRHEATREEHDRGVARDAECLARRGALRVTGNVEERRVDRIRDERRAQIGRDVLCEPVAHVLAHERDVTRAAQDVAASGAIRGRKKRINEATAERHHRHVLRDDVGSSLSRRRDARGVEAVMHVGNVRARHGARDGAPATQADERERHRKAALEDVRVGDAHKANAFFGRVTRRERRRAGDPADLVPRVGVRTREERGDLLDATGVRRHVVRDDRDAHQRRTRRPSTERKNEATIVSKPSASAAEETMT